MIGDKINEVKIIAFVGMSGSGKSVAVDFLTEQGVPKVYFGGMILKEIERRGLTRTPEIEQEVRVDVREKFGNDWVVRQVIEETKHLIEAGQRRIVLDGVYSWTEYNILKQEFPGMLTFVAVVVDKKLRYKRVADRPNRPFNRNEIIERDNNEIEKLEKGGPIAAADYYILNNGSVADFHQNLQNILETIKF